MQRVQPLEKRRQQIGLAIERALPGHQHVGGVDDHGAQRGFHLAHGIGARAQAKLGAHVLVEKKRGGFCARQMGGVGTGDDHRIKRAQRRGRQKRKHHRAFNRAIPKGGGFKYTAQPTPPVGKGNGEVVASELFTQAREQLQQLFTGGIRLQTAKVGRFSAHTNLLQTVRQQREPLRNGRAPPLHKARRMLQTQQHLPRLDIVARCGQRDKILKTRHHIGAAHLLLETLHHGVARVTRPVMQRERRFE